MKLPYILGNRGLNGSFKSLFETQDD